MLYRNVNCLSLFVLCIAFMVVIEGASAPSWPLRPSGGGQIYPCKFPQGSALWASFEGTMIDWSDAQIQNAFKDRHPESGDTILHIPRNREIIQKILSVPSGEYLLDIANRVGNLPIHQFAFRLHGSLMEGLLITLEERGVLANFINRPNKQFKDAPLHIAVARGAWEVFEVLVAYGADLQLRNNRNETPEGIVRRMTRSDKKFDKDRRLSIEAYQRSVEQGILRLKARLGQRSVGLEVSKNVKQEAAICAIHTVTTLGTIAPPLRVQSMVETDGVPKFDPLQERRILQ